MSTRSRPFDWGRLGKALRRHWPLRLVLTLVIIALCGWILLSGCPYSPAVSVVADAPGYQLLVNPGLESYDPPYAQYLGVDCQVASGWERFGYEAPEPGWMDTRVFAASPLGSGWVERIEGVTSQLLVSTEPYTAGVRQRVTGLTPGTGYGFHAALITLFQSSAQPTAHGTMIKRVGIDPAGGMDPLAPTVVWSEPGDRDKEWDLQRRVSARADGTSVSVFIQINSLEEAGPWPFLNLSVLDSAILAQTPEVSATSPPVSPVPTFTVNWDNAVAAPGGGELKHRDVQWMDVADGVWHDWIVDTYNVEAPFSGEPGHAYRFRARAWQRYPNNAWLHSPYRSEGDTETLVAGAGLNGTVTNATGSALAGATVAISGTTYAATSGLDGRYEMNLPQFSELQTIKLSHPTLPAPGPVYDVSFGPTQTVGITWTLRPRDDAVSNGQFEEGLAGWNLLAVPGITPTVITAEVHTGRHALLLRGGAPTSSTIGVTQTLAVTDTWAPAMSFWYQSDSPDAGDWLNVKIALLQKPLDPAHPMTMTHVFTPSLGTGGWLHLWYPFGPRDTALTGTVSLSFLLRDNGAGPDPTIHVDEVSFGSTPGGPRKVYVPVVLR